MKSIRRPDAADEQSSPQEIARQSDENLARYLALIRRIYERICSDPEAYARFRTLTGSEYGPTIQSERSKPT